MGWTSSNTAHNSSNGCESQSYMLSRSVTWNSHDGRLVAVLVRLADRAHAEHIGAWFLEAGFGPCACAQWPVFDSLEMARDWVRRQLGA